MPHAPGSNCSPKSNRNVAGIAIARWRGEANVGGSVRLLATVGLVAAALLASTVGARSAAMFFGPTPYLCFDSLQVTGCGNAESPFVGTLTNNDYQYFFLENFQDSLFNTAGVTASVGAPISAGVFGVDSVDEDDGAIDGFGLGPIQGGGGASFFSSNGGVGITFTFDASMLGQLPSDVGIVWTDGVDPVRFQAFGPGHVSLGSVTAGAIADANFSGGTAEDRFFGVTDPNGIESIFIVSGSAGIEVDHLQYGLRVGTDPGGGTPGGDPGGGTPGGDPGSGTPGGDPGTGTPGGDPGAGTIGAGEGADKLPPRLIQATASTSAGDMLDNAATAGIVTAVAPPATDEPYDTEAHAEAQLTPGIGAPTVGSRSIAPTDCQSCVQEQTATAKSLARGQFVPFFADPASPPDSIDLDLILTFDGILDIAYSQSHPNSPLANFSLEANLYTTDPTDGGSVPVAGLCSSCFVIPLFNGGVELVTSITGGTQTFRFNTEDSKAEISDSDIFDNGPNTFFGGISTSSDFVNSTKLIDVQFEFEDVAFLSFNEAFSLELILTSVARANDDGDFSSYALSDFLNTGELIAMSDTPRISFVTLDAVADSAAVTGPAGLGPFAIGAAGLAVMVWRRRRRERVAGPAIVPRRARAGIVRS
ncbi:MAG: hypothetical protein AB7P12_18190 [Alphaproteobacteria bacterium]